MNDLCNRVRQWGEYQPYGETGLRWSGWFDYEGDADT